MTFIVTVSGHSRSQKSIGQWFSKACRKAGVEKNAQGIRKHRAAVFAENGATEEQRVAVLGHETLSETRNYSKSASLQDIISGIESARLVKPSSKNAKKGNKIKGFLQWRRCCQTNSNQSQFAAETVNLSGTKQASLGEGGVTCLLEVFSTSGRSFLIEVIVDGRVNGGEFLHTSHAPETWHRMFPASKLLLFGLATHTVRQGPDCTSNCLCLSLQ